MLNLTIKFLGIARPTTRLSVSHNFYELNYPYNDKGNSYPDEKKRHEHRFFQNQELLFMLQVIDELPHPLS